MTETATKYVYDFIEKIRGDFDRFYNCKVLHTYVRLESRIEVNIHSKKNNYRTHESVQLELKYMSLKTVLSRKKLL